MVTCVSTLDGHVICIECGITVSSINKKTILSHMVLCQVGCYQCTPERLGERRVLYGLGRACVGGLPVGDIEVYVLIFVLTSYTTLI